MNEQTILEMALGIARPDPPPMGPQLRCGELRLRDCAFIACYGLEWTTDAAALVNCGACGECWPAAAALDDTQSRL